MKVNINSERILKLFEKMQMIQDKKMIGSMESSDDEQEDTCFTPFPHFSTMAIHAGQDPKQWNSRAVVPPISLSTTFQLEEAGVIRPGAYEYTRCGNPTRNVTEACVGALEHAKHCLLFGSGLAAMVTMYHVLKSGDHVVCMDDVYGGTNRYLKHVLVDMNVETTFVDATILQNVQNALRPNTKIVWLESPTNPTMKVVDIAEVSRIAHLQPNVLVVVDNTFMSSYFQRPLELGADVSFQSLTKYMNGHSDVLIGSLSLNNDELAEKLRFLQYSLGGVPSPFDCYLLNRGLKTLSLRMKEHMKNGLLVARYLEKNPRVEKVLHPGLTHHPQHHVAIKQCKGFSGMLSFYIKGHLAEAKIFLSALKMFMLAESLGGYESLAEHPSVMTHAAVDEDEKLRLGIKDNLIRLSVGLEEVQDLIDDLEQALVKAIPVL